MIKIHIDPGTRFVHICIFSLTQEFDSTPQTRDTPYVVLKSSTLSNTFLHYYCKPYLPILLGSSAIVLNQPILSRSDITALRQKRLHDCQYVENCVFSGNCRTFVITLDKNSLGFTTQELSIARTLAHQQELNKLLARIKPVYQPGNDVCYLVNSPSTLPVEKRFNYERQVFTAAGYKVNFTEIDENLIRLDYEVQ